MRWVLFSVLMMAGCATSDDYSDDEPVIDSDVESIRIDPAVITISTDGTTPATVRFTAYATTESGEEVETDMVSWSVSNLSAGEINSRGKFESSTLNGGVTTVTATHVGIEGTAQITVVYEQDLVEGELGDALVAAFDAATPVDSEYPYIEYPSDGVTVPRNLEGLAFNWEAPGGTNVTRLRMQSGITDMSVYTVGDTWYSNSDLWATIAASNTEGSVDVTIESGAWDGTTLSNVYRGPPFRLTVNRLDARGSVLYWVARTEIDGQPGGDIMRIPFGSTQSEAFWSVEDSGQCVGCHTLVEAGDKMVVTHQGVNGNFSVIDVSDPTYPETWLWTAEERRATFHAASPSGEFLLTVADGRARLYNLFTGAQVMELDTEGYQVSHPDWSPAGDYILLVRITSTSMNDMNFEGGEIIRMAWNGNNFGPAEVLVPATADRNNYYPSFSPDGEWIAYNRAVVTEIQRAGSSEVTYSSTSYANPSAELWLMTKDGTYQTRLDNANGVGELQNSFPRWGPLPDDDVLWLAFSSTRPYPVDPNFNRFLMWLPQIWVTAIEPEKILNAEDPSSTPFWLPAQDSQSDNHLAIWWSK